VLSSPTLHALALSICPGSWIGTGNATAPPHLTAVLPWFRASFALDGQSDDTEWSGGGGGSGGSGDGGGGALGRFAAAQDRAAMTARRRGKQRRVATPSPILIGSSDDESDMVVGTDGPLLEGEVDRMANGDAPLTVTGAALRTSGRGGGVNRGGRVRGLGREGNGQGREGGGAGKRVDADDRVSRLTQRFATFTGDASEIVDLFIIICRALGWSTRLVWVLRPEPEIGASRKRRRKQSDEPTATSGAVPTDVDSGRERRDSSSGKRGKGKAKGCQLGKPLRKNASTPATGGAAATLTVDPNRRCLNKTPAAAVECWAEVHIDGEWMTVNCVSGVFGSPLELEPRCDAPFVYVLAVTHGVDIDAHGVLKDVTARYANDWLTSTERCRPDSKFWELLLHPPGQLVGVQDASDTEDATMAAALEELGVPRTIAGVKNHKLYILERHLRGNQVRGVGATLRSACT
jgi:hypothetical protein